MDLGASPFSLSNVHKMALTPDPWCSSSVVLNPSAPWTIHLTTVSFFLHTYMSCTTHILLCHSWFSHTSYSSPHTFLFDVTTDNHCWKWSEILCECCWKVGRRRSTTAAPLSNCSDLHRLSCDLSFLRRFCCLDKVWRTIFLFLVCCLFI